jgi:histidyl-tRNA synthetase
MAEKEKKLKARLPRGVNDRGPAELSAEREMLEKIRAVFERYGFEAVETPAIEYSDVLGKFLPDQDRPHEGVFSFQDDDEQWLSLRYDLTAPLARYVAENFDKLPKPCRSYRVGYVFRDEKPGPGRYRQFLQFDADTVGTSSVAADAEMCMLAADTMEALGIKRGDYVIKVNSRKVLDGLLDAARAFEPSQRLTILRAIDKLDRLERGDVHQLLTRGRKDASGDFTKGAGLRDEDANLILEFVAPSEPTENVRATETTDSDILFSMPDSWDALAAHPKFLEGTRELLQIKKLFESVGYGSDRILIDQTVVRGLEYYTGPVFEAELTFKTKDGTRFGSVGGGGRYDGLVARFRGEPAPATGFSIGVSRLLAALQHLGKIKSEAAHGPVVVTVFDRDRIADYQRMVKSLRDAGIRAELYLGDGKMGPQLRYADKRNAPCVVIQGGDEKAKGEVQIKDLIEGTEAAKAIASNKEWRASRPAQFSVPETKLVEAVREVLARHSK